MGQMSRVSTNNTKVFTDLDGSLCVMLHNTIVWRRKLDGTVILDTGGWRTVTTKARMNQAFNQFGPSYAVGQNKGEWSVRNWETGVEIPFDDRTLEIPATGEAARIANHRFKIGRDDA